MNVLNLISVMAGGAIGAGLRYGISHWLANPEEIIPLGTLTVNILGSLILGALFSYAQMHSFNETYRLFLMTGILGALTTFSTFAVESLYLFQMGEIRYGMLNLIAHNGGGLLAAFLGFVIIRWLLG